jgi:hypothetical protein
MIVYPKIESIFKRDNKTHKFIEGKYTLPEFEYLKDNQWLFTEKVDGMNIRIIWNHKTKELLFRGRTDDAQMPMFLLEKLHILFPYDIFPMIYPNVSMCLYGEGYGAKIQKGGGNYIPNGVDFVLFDVIIMDWWLKCDSIRDIATKLKIRTVPLIDHGTLDEAVKLCKCGFRSAVGNRWGEGLVLRPLVELRTRRGDRIITKLKSKDWEK